MQGRGEGISVKKIKEFMLADSTLIFEQIDRLTRHNTEIKFCPLVYRTPLAKIHPETA